MSTLIILDNTVLSNLALIGHAHLVFDLWADPVCSTQAVMDEYHKAAIAGLLPPNAWDGLPILSLDQIEAKSADALSTRLGAGERSCIAVALHRHGTLVSDDADARAAASARRHPGNRDGGSSRVRHSTRVVIANAR